MEDKKEPVKPTTKGKKGFNKGNKAGGRPKGSQNKLTTTIKENVIDVFNQLQEHPTANLYSFAVKNTKEFYLIAAKIIPTEIVGNLKTTAVKVIRE